MSIRVKAALIIMAIVLVVAAIGCPTNFFLIKSNTNAALLIISSLIFLAAGLLVSIFASPLVAWPFEKSEVDEFESDLKLCMGMIARAMEIDRVYIWKNHEKDGRRYHTQMYEWSDGAEPQRKTAYVVDLRHCKKLPGWEDALLSGKCINSPVRNLPAEDQLMLSSPGTQSVFILPVFLSDKFWGFIGYDDCHRKRVFTENEQSILSLAGNVIAYAVFQNEMTKSVHAGIAELSKLRTEIDVALTEIEAAFMETDEEYEFASTEQTIKQCEAIRNQLNTEEQLAS